MHYSPRLDLTIVYIHADHNFFPVYLKRLEYDRTNKRIGVTACLLTLMIKTKEIFIISMF